MNPRKSLPGSDEKSGAIFAREAFALSRPVAREGKDLPSLQTWVMLGLHTTPNTEPTHARPPQRRLRIYSLKTVDVIQPEVGDSRV
jgi:hypothetical protein